MFARPPPPARSDYTSDSPGHASTWEETRRFLKVLLSFGPALAALALWAALDGGGGGGGGGGGAGGAHDGAGGDGATTTPPGSDATLDGGPPAGRTVPPPLPSSALILGLAALLDAVALPAAVVTFGARPDPPHGFSVRYRALRAVCVAAVAVNAALCLLGGAAAAGGCAGVVFGAVGAGAGGEGGGESGGAGCPPGAVVPPALGAGLCAVLASLLCLILPSDPEKGRGRSAVVGYSAPAPPPGWGERESRILGASSFGDDDDEEEGMLEMSTH